MRQVLEFNQSQWLKKYIEPFIEPYINTKQCYTRKSNGKLKK